MKEKISSHFGLVETASVVTHDLGAQLHVMKFCLDELLAVSTFPGGEKNEFVLQLRMRTDYVENLLIGFKKLLTMSREENGEYLSYNSFNYAKELLRNHYPSYSSRISFEGFGDKEEDFISPISNCTICMHMIFSICSCFIEWESEKNKLDQFNFFFDLEYKDINDYIFTIKLAKASMDEKEFLNLVESRSHNRGRVRQWCGLEYFSDLNESVNSFYTFEKNKDYSCITFKLPVNEK